MTTTNVAVQLTSSELKLLQNLVYQECGMFFDERRTHFLEDRLQRRLKEREIDSFYSYYRLLISDQGKEELARLLEDLTVNETSFFRNKAQLDLFHKYVLEDLLRQKYKDKQFSLKMWSAGCSTGQEPYTMAMLVADGLGLYSSATLLPERLSTRNPWYRRRGELRSRPATSTIQYFVRRRRASIANRRWPRWTITTACATSTSWATAMQ